MGVYDDVTHFCDDVYSPTSTVSTSSSSGLASPVYENVEELTGLCSRSWKMMGASKRASKPSMSDFLAQIPPPPPGYDDGYGGFMKRGEAPTSTTSSCASSRRPIISNPPAVVVSTSSSLPSPPPPSSSSSSSTNPPARCFDMRPLSLPHKEMQRIEREQSHRSVLLMSNPNRFDIPDYYAFTPACPARVLIITLLIITIFIVLIALSIYMFFDEIESHINNIADSF